MNYRNLLSRYRGAIMGLMAIIIILYHSRWHSPFALYNATIGRHGSTAVDVFVFLSGFGLAHSLAKSRSFGEYYSRRLRRVLPTYYMHLLLCVLVALVCMAGGKRANIARYLATRVFPMGIWVNYPAPKWYVGGSLGFYVIAAMIYPAMRKSRYLSLTTAFFLLLTGYYVPAIARMDNVLWVLERVPALVVGLAVGEADQRDEPRYRRTWPELAALAFLFAVGTAMFVMEGRLPGPALSRVDGPSYTCLRQALMAPLITVILSCGFELCERLRLGFVNRAFGWLGRLSLELYLVHTILRNFIRLLAIPNAVIILLTVAASCPAAAMLKWLAERLLRLWQSAVLKRIVRD